MLPSLSPLIFICSSLSTSFRGIGTLLPICIFFFFKQKTAYVLRISHWSSDVCSSDLSLFPIPLALTIWRGIHICQDSCIEVRLEARRTFNRVTAFGAADYIAILLVDLNVLADAASTKGVCTLDNQMWRTHDILANRAWVSLTQGDPSYGCFGLGRCCDKACTHAGVRQVIHSDRKSVVSGKSGSVRVVMGGGRIIK